MAQKKTNRDLRKKTRNSLQTVQEIVLSNFDLSSLQTVHEKITRKKNSQFQSKTPLIKTTKHYKQTKSQTLITKLNLPLQKMNFLLSFFPSNNMEARAQNLPQISRLQKLQIPSDLKTPPKTVHQAQTQTMDSQKPLKKKERKKRNLEQVLEIRGPPVLVLVLVDHSLENSTLSPKLSEQRPQLFLEIFLFRTSH